MANVGLAVSLYCFLAFVVAGMTRIMSCGYGMRRLRALRDSRHSAHSDQLKPLYSLLGWFSVEVVFAMDWQCGLGCFVVVVRSLFLLLLG